MRVHRRIARSVQLHVAAEHRVPATEELLQSPFVFSMDYPGIFPDALRAPDFLCVSFVFPMK